MVITRLQQVNLLQTCLDNPQDLDCLAKNKRHPNKRQARCLEDSSNNKHPQAFRQVAYGNHSRANLPTQALMQVAAAFSEVLQRRIKAQAVCLVANHNLSRQDCLDKHRQLVEVCLEIPRKTHQIKAAGFLADNSNRLAHFLVANPSSSLQLVFLEQVNHSSNKTNNQVFGDNRPSKTLVNNLKIKPKD